MEYTVNIEKLDHLGRGIGKINNKIIFVNKSLPGDVVKIIIVKEKKNFFEGKVVSFIKKSSLRTEFLCPYYTICGGCQLGELDYKEQLIYKKNKVENIFYKYANISLEMDIIGSDIICGYRNKITFDVINNKLALHDIDNNLFNINQCLLVSDNVNNKLSKINDESLNDVNKVTIRENDDNLMVIYNDKIIYGENKLIENINGFNYVISANSFFQINKNVTEKMYNKIKEYANLDISDNVMDLYCGTGTIGLFLCSSCNKVLGIEINENSIIDAEYNKKLNNIDNIEFICGDVGDVINSSYKFDVVIVDPPRSGLDKNTINTLLKINPKRIIYVSCDPMTLVRDIVLFNNYKLKDITLFDMFPNTYHVESVVVLERK